MNVVVQSSRERTDNLRRRQSVVDSVFLTGMVVLSSVLYLAGLGFYSDDWSIIGYASMSGDQSYFGVFRAIYGPLVQMRPVQFLYAAGLYKVFSHDPLGYHLVNTLVMAAGAVLFYRVLRESGEPRRISVALPLVYVLLPHYSTDRLWLAAFQAMLSMTLFFLSLYADLRAWRSQGRKYGGWKSVALFGMLGSILAYEVFVPFFLLIPLWVGFVTWRQHTERTPGMKALVLFALPNLLVLGAALIFKVTSTSRADFGADDPVYHIQWFIWLIEASLRVGFIDYGLALPLRLWQIAQAYFDLWTFVTAGIFGLLVFLFLNRSRKRSDGFNRIRMVVYWVVGLVVFVTGYAIFLTNYNAFVTPTGIANRVAIAGTLGVAICFVAVAVGVSSLFRSPSWRKGCFSILIALLTTSGFLINTTIASFWVEAYRKEKQILTAIHRHFPDLPEGSTILLDGVCPYAGPAVVFESNWDLRGALMMHYRDYELRADIITPASKIEDEGLSTSIYEGSIYTLYPYGENVFIYDYGRDASAPLPDRQAARRYFETYNPDFNGDCPEGKAGYGVSIF